jgi:WXG100 family type VII secretion target
MSSNIIQADYEKLDTLARRFSEQSESCHQLFQQVAAKARDLQEEGWEGRGSAAFYAEMEEYVMPAMRRVVRALAAGGTVTSKIRDVMRQAEEEAVRPFIGNNAFAMELQAAFAIGGSAAVKQVVHAQAFPNGNAAPGWLGGVGANAQVQVKAGFPQADRNLKTPAPQTVVMMEKMLSTAKDLWKHGTPESRALSNILLAEAALVAAFSHGVDITNVKSFRFDRHLGQEGDTNSSGGTRIGPLAFYDEALQPNVPELAAIVLHESTHADQYVAHKTHGRIVDADARVIPSSGQLYYVDEAEAYKTMVRNAGKLGLSPAQKKFYGGRVDDHLKMIKSSRARSLAQAGKFEQARRIIDPGL